MKKCFFTAIAIMLGLLGWAANNYRSTDAVVLFLAMIGLVGAAGFGVWNYKRLSNYWRNSRMLNSILMAIMGGVFIIFIYYLAYDAWKDYSKKDK